MTLWSILWVYLEHNTGFICFSATRPPRPQIFGVTSCSNLHISVALWLLLETIVDFRIMSMGRTGRLQCLSQGSPGRTSAQGYVTLVLTTLVLTLRFVVESEIVEDIS